MATRSTSARCTPNARGSVKLKSARSSGAPGAAVQLPVHRPGPPRVGRGHRRGPAHPEPAPRSSPTSDGEFSPGPERGPATSRSWPGWARDAETRPATPRAPAGWARPGEAGSVRGTRPRWRVQRPGRACVWSTPRSWPYVTNGNIYAPVMMMAEEGGRPDTREHPAAPRTAGVSNRHQKDALATQARARRLRNPAGPPGSSPGRPRN